jgi:hypothetical protein
MTRLARAGVLAFIMAQVIGAGAAVLLSGWLREAFPLQNSLQNFAGRDKKAIMNQ